MHQLATKCAQKVMETQGKTEDEATTIVCKFIQDSSKYQPDMLMAAMKMIFLDESVEVASQNIQF